MNSQGIVDVRKSIAIVHTNISCPEFDLVSSCSVLEEELSSRRGERERESFDF